MGSREAKPRFVLVVFLVMFLVTAATSRSLSSSKKKCTSSTACHLRFAATLHEHKHLEMKDYGQGDEAPPYDDYYHDFYKKHGEVPSPGVGH
ncbi:hypothetical protein L6164_030185 [Bauhinia variegata]|uniref:Uncharacterized protein n=1 Tax=Bauhinia variegata TaxID=167791 RepID=A0ACB9LBK7_BAUVA|nr:hypothetical protein L6164_030185 [Bauhinia variegata]